jgi:hypothetical protein
VEEAGAAAAVAGAAADGGDWTADGAAILCGGGYSHSDSFVALLE